MWGAHFIFHLLVGFDAPLAVLHRLTDAAASAGKLSSVITSALPVIEILLLDFGLLVTLYAAWRIARRRTAKNAFLLLLPWAVLAILLYLAGIWIVFQPMEMRGTMLS